MNTDNYFLHPKEWYIELLVFVGILAAALGLTGAYWDIGWHFDYGRDTFWSPPHLFIYGSILLMTVFFALNFFMARKYGFHNKRRSLYLLIIFGLIANGIIYLAAPLDELWHRLFGIDVQIWSLPHMMLIIGGVMGGMAVVGILRNHIAHERKRFLLEQILASVFLGSILAGVMLVFAESEFPTLPEWHPVQNRDPWVYPGYSLLFALVVFFTAKRISSLRWAATFTFFGFTLLRIIPVLFNALMGMESVPIMPPFLPILLVMALSVDLVKRKK